MTTFHFPLLFGGSLPEWGIILVIALLVFGSSKIPKLARSLGESIVEFKKGIKGVGDDDDERLPEGEKPKQIPKETQP